MPHFVIREISRITRKGQTTVPKAVRQALGVDRGGSIAFRIEGRSVTLERADEEHDDPALEGFLSLLAKDVAAQAQDIPSALALRLFALTEGVRVDLDEAIDGPVAL